MKILMVSEPGGTRGPANAYGHHIKAIEGSKNYQVCSIAELSSIDQVQNFDVLWFSVRFDPRIYYLMKDKFPNKKYVMGPNVLFEKAEVGPSDEWEKWFVETVTCDLYTNKAAFYLARANHFFKGSKRYEVLRNCIDLKGYVEFEENCDKDIDVLVYYKNRRIDDQLDSLYPTLKSQLDDLGLSIETIRYGEYDRNLYFKTLNRSKLCLWLSIEDFCSNAQLEAQYFNVPIIGTMYNNTDAYDPSFNVGAATNTREDWIRWTDDMPKKFIERIESFFENDIDMVGDKPSKFIKENYSYVAYIRQLDRML